MDLNEITKEAFKPENMLANGNPRKGKFLAGSIMYRGDIVPKEVSIAFSELKTDKTIRYVDWAPSGFKIGINYAIPLVFLNGDLAMTMKRCCMIGNSTAISSIFSELSHKFDLMYGKRAFVH